MTSYHPQADRIEAEDENALSTGRYWAVREAELNADVAAEREYAQSPEGRLERLYKQAEALDFGRRDGGYYTDEQCHEAWTAYEALKTQIEAPEQARFAAEWTLEVTRTRRAEWNTFVKTGGIGQLGSGQVDFRALTAREEAQGWIVEDLKAAVKAYRL